MNKRLSALLLPLIFAGRCVSAATLTFTTSAPPPQASAVSNFVGASYDANNVGGNGTNSDGGANNGSTNDGTTCVAASRPAQGQTFTTGANPGGYTLTDITVRAAGYTANTATGSNVTSYSLASTSSVFQVRVGRISGTTFVPVTVETAASGGKDNPGTGGSANGSGVFLTFTFKAPVVLQPNTVYAFDIGTSGDYFETLGIRDAAGGGNPYAAGTAYVSGAGGAGAGTITTQAGDRVFQVNLTAYTVPAAGAFVHPGLLSTEADFERMRTNVASGIQPWASAYGALTASWMGKQSGGWSPNAQATITRSGSLNNTSLLYNDIAVAYGSALRWKISGDTAYADQAVKILNAWGSTFTSVQGDTNVLLTELYGYQFVAAAEIMRSYPGWAAADITQFQTMIYNVFYPLADNFLNGHFGTAYDHYWANWDLAAMNTMYAIGVFCDNPTLTAEALNCFYTGVGNGCIDRTVNFIHPGMLGQGQEIGRDQGHATLDVAELATLCQMAWNQGTDLFGYENNRVLALAEYTAKYNLGQDVPFTPYASGSWLMTAPGSGSRGANNARPGWPTFYHHYVNLMGLAAPYTTQMASNMGTGWYFNGDSPGWDALTAALPPIAAGANPSGLTAAINGQQPQLSWWGSAYATSYNVKRATSPGGPYATVATGVTANTYTDVSPAVGVTNYYVVTGSLSGGGETGNSNETQVVLGSPVYALLSFNESSGTTATDYSGNGWSGTLVNGATWTTGKINGAVNLAKASSQYVSLPAGVVANLSDFSISAWVYQNSASTQARIFDFGSGDGTWGGVDTWGNQLWLAERYMFLTSQGSSGNVRFGITHSSGAGSEYVDGTSPLPVGQWVHVTVTRSGGVATLYVNGQVVGQNLSMPMAPLQFPVTTQNYLGKSQWRNDPYFDGKIDDFRIYRGGLTAGQVYTLATGFTPAAPAPAPATLTATALTGGQMFLSWSAVGGATTYTVRRATSPGGPYIAVASLLTGTTFTDGSLTPGTTYYYQVDGVNTGGDGANSTAASAVALPPLPASPTGIVTTATSATSVGLAWTAAANAAGYNVKRSLTSGGPYATIASGVATTSFADTNLTDGTTYFYVVSAVNAAGESANSSEGNATPSDLLAQLKFDETGGTAASDSTGNGWNGTAVNAPIWSTGRLGNALTLASASSQNVTLPGGVVNGIGSFTIMTWVKMNTQTNWQRVFDFGTGTTNYMFLTTATSSSNLMRFSIRTPSVSEQQITSTVATPAGSWVHVAVTLTGGVGRIYLNGTLAGTNGAMTLTPASLGVTTLNYLGKSQFSADPYLNASVDDFRLYTRALSASEIAGLASAPLAAPQNVTVANGFQQVTLNWSAVPNATSYVVRSGLVSGGPYTKVASGSAATSFTQTGVAGSTAYYVVSAVGPFGEGPNSGEVSGGPLATPGALTGLTAAAGNASATINWTPSSAAVSYNLYRSTDSETGYALVSGGLTGATYTDTGLINGTTYYYEVTGVNAGGEGPVSAVASATPMAPPVITSAGTASVVYGGTFNYQITASNTPTSYGATGLPAGFSVDLATGIISGAGTAVGTYHATISATNVGGTGSAALTIVVQLVAPAAPTGLTAARGDGMAILSWKVSSGATSYIVKRSLTNGSGYTTVASNLTTLNFTDTGLTNGTTYYYVVSAVNAAGQSVNSVQFSATPAATTADWFTQLFTTNNTTSNTTFTFTPASNVNKYVVSRRTGVTAFPASTTGVTAITGGDDTSTKVTLAGTSKVSLYGVSYASFYIGSNGFITFASDVNYAASLANHFKKPRISALFDDLDSSSKGTMSWIQLADRVAVTWANVPQYGTTNSNNFQVEMFFDGRIRITCLAIADTGGLIGLSGVSAQPSNLVQSTFSSYPAPLAAPGGLTATGNGASVALDWNDSVGATTYNIKRSLTSGSGYTTVATGVSATNYTDTGLTNGTTYYYIVSAVNALVGEGIDSVESSATPALPAAPVGLTATGGNAQVSLGWTPSVGATSYNVKRSLTSGGSYATVANTATATYTDTSVTNGTAYYYVVSVVKGTTESANSASVTAMPMSAIQSWRQTYFNTPNATGDAADNADPDHDGIPNLIEYATGTNPIAPQAGRPVSWGKTADGKYLTLTFNEIADPALTYSVLASNDLRTWQVIWTSTGAQNVNGPAGVTVTDPELISNHPSRFLELQISR